MSILIRDLLTFKEFESAKIIAGEEGLTNAITRVNFLELTLKQFNENLLLDVSNFVSVGDLYLTSNMFFEQKDVDFYEEFEFLIRQRSSGVCIVGYTEGLIDDRVLDLIKRHDYPVISIDYKVPYSSLIDAVMTAIIRDNLDQRKDNMMELILDKDCEYGQMVKYLEEINPNLKDNYVTLYISVPNNNITNVIRNRLWEDTQDILIQKYDIGTIVTITSNNTKDSILTSTIHKVEELIRKLFGEANIGVSDYYEDIKYFRDSVYEAIFSCKLARKNQVLVTNHSDMGMEKWLYKLSEDKDLLSYVNDIMDPILEYEKQYNINLMNIINSFVKNEGNYKAISKELYLHENTVRYRMDKVKDILDVGSNKVTLYTKLNILVNLRKIVEIYKDEPMR